MLAALVGWLGCCARRLERAYRPIILAAAVGTIIAIALGGLWLAVDQIFAGRDTRLRTYDAVCLQVNHQTIVLRHILATDLPADTQLAKRVRSSQIASLTLINCRGTRAQ